MLFDLRGAGRRRTVKVVYIALAFLMGGGLVLFGIGGGGGISGGLVDAITGTSGGGDTGAARFEKQEKAALAKTTANPKDAPAWAALARARFQVAGAGSNFDPAKGSFTTAGAAKLTAAGDAWEHYLALNPKKPDDRVAGLMVQAFGALNKPDKAAEAQEVITNVRPTASTFTSLAIYAYQAGQTRKGDLATNKALQLTPADMRQALKGQLQQAKQSAATGGAAAQPSATP
jgi:hypothetical protein